MKLLKDNDCLKISLGGAVIISYTLTTTFRRLPDNHALSSIPKCGKLSCILRLHVILGEIDYINRQIGFLIPG